MISTNNLLKRAASIIRTRTTKTLAESVPLNAKRYAPKGYYGFKDIDESYNGLNGEWRSHVHNELEIPEELYRQTTDFMRLEVFDERRSSVSSEYLVGAISAPNGRVYTYSPERVIPFDGNGKVMTDVLFHHCKSSFETDYSLNIKFFPKPAHINGAAASLLAGGGSGINIAHWMLDVIPRLACIEKIRPLDSIDKVIVPGSRTSYKVESLRRLGIDESKIIFSTSQLTHIEADHLLFATPPRSHNKVLVPEWVNTFHRSRFLDPDNKEKNDYPKRIYISRRDSSLRGVVNEDEVINTLKRKGFTEIVLSRFPYDEKIALFANAEEIVSMSGAGLTFLMFCKPETKVLELFPKDFIHYVNYNLAKLNKLDYRYLVFGKGVTDKSARHAQRSSLKINIDDMLSMIS